MWKKKLREYKGRNYKYSLRKKLKREKKITDDFEVMLYSLTLEEVIGLKLELAASHINNKLYNFPVYRSIRYIVKEACLHFALSSTRTFGDAASFLGIKPGELRKEISKYKIDLKEMTFDSLDESI
tara:strand:- start:400 stop:777 length:378 start_codon:yes stop_codon:yes gene_type:complete